MKRILLIQTGGTIAMDISAEEGTHELDPDKWLKVLYREIPELSEIASVEIELLYFEDSSDIHREHWSGLIERIEQKYDRYDGFVILHGTDTMAYTASALSYGLQYLNKPVILTGSQVPMSNIRSDARRNLVNAIEMATLSLNEVSICFNDHFFRGNRTTKMSIGDFDAFSSPNFPPLAEIGLNIEINTQLQHSGKELETYPRFDDRVFLLSLFPNFDPGLLEQIDLSGLQAVVIEAFGSGNFPIKGKYSMVPFIERCIGRNKWVIITSQAPYDSVDLSAYESGRVAKDLGVLSAGDMTTEATLTKIMYLLENADSDEQVKKLFNQNLMGERTE